MSQDDFKAWRMEVSRLLERSIRLKHTEFVNISFLDKNENDCALGKIPVITIDSYENVVKIIGRMKTHFSDRELRILLRGQQSHHRFIQLPSLLRIIDYGKWDLVSSQKIHTSWDGFLEFYQQYSSSPEKIDSIRESVNTIKNTIQLYYDSALPEKIHIPNMLAWEAILQHYNFKTRYIDLVDNLPIALYFAGKPDSNLEDDHKFGYLFIYGIYVNRRISKGIWDGPYQRLVNLAEATNPKALRPHIQYAFSLLEKSVFNLDLKYLHLRENIFKLTQCDYSKYVLAVLKIKRSKIREWLCFNSSLPYFLQTETLFPSNDIFYKEIKAWEDTIKEIIKKIFRDFSFKSNLDDLQLKHAKQLVLMEFSSLMDYLEKELEEK